MAKPSLGGLSSFSIRQLAKRWGYDEADVIDCILTGQLRPHLLVHEVPVSTYGGTMPGIARPNGETISGHFEIPWESAAAVLKDSRPGMDGSVEIVLGDDGKRVVVVDVLHRINSDHIRILRAEVERYESTVSGRSDNASELNRDSQRHRERCRAVAELLWHREPNLTIEEMIDRDEFARFGQQGQCYDRKVLRRWVNDLCPDRRPGRRPKSPRE